MEAVFARGDRRLNDVLIKAVQLGCKFDGWREHFNYALWVKAFENSGIDPDFYACRERDYGELLPWELIDAGLTKEFLVNENKKAMEEIQSADCRHQCNHCGINQKVKCTREGTL